MKKTVASFFAITIFLSMYVQNISCNDTVSANDDLLRYKNLVFKNSVVERFYTLQEMSRYFFNFYAFFTRKDYQKNQKILPIILLRKLDECMEENIPREHVKTCQELKDKLSSISSTYTLQEHDTFNKMIELIDRNIHRSIINDFIDILNENEKEFNNIAYKCLLKSWSDSLSYPSKNSSYFQKHYAICATSYLNAEKVAQCLNLKKVIEENKNHFNSDPEKSVADSMINNIDKNIVYSATREEYFAALKDLYEN